MVIHDDLYCLNCLLSLRSERNRNFHDNVCIDSEACHFKMQNDKHSMSDYCHGVKSIRRALVIYNDFELILEKMDSVIIIQKNLL